MTCYLPQPPRVWSRVQNSCYLEQSYDYNTKQMLVKGNVLQYKANSSNLTKSQKYSKIATGQWINRNTTWATQNINGYTNPNTTFLKRSGNVFNIAINPITGQIIGPTLEPVTCPKQEIIINNSLPNIIEPTILQNIYNTNVNKGLLYSSSSSNTLKEIPQPINPTQQSNIFPPEVPNTQPLEQIVIQDGGSLICSIQENVCTGETKTSLGQKLCNPTTDSDVPGSIQELCWNDGTQTWYPKQRYFMNNSTDKWPYNYKFFTSAVRPPTPSLDAEINNNIIVLKWFINYNTCSCLPVIKYIIYVNNNIYETLSSSVTSITINKTLPEYSIYVVAINDTIESFKSNVIVLS